MISCIRNRDKVFAKVSELIYQEEVTERPASKGFMNVKIARDVHTEKNAANKRLFGRGEKAVILELTLISCGFNLYKYRNKRHRLSSAA